MPATTEFTIHELHTIEAFEGTTSLVFGGVKLGGRAGGVGATVESEGFKIGVSKLDGEELWIIDSMFKADNGFPIFSNGEGCRAIRLRTLVNEELIAELDRRAGELVA